MKAALLALCILFIMRQGFSQDTFEREDPLPVFSVRQDPHYSKKHDRILSGSFYQSKGEWQAIIDSTWGPGVPLEQKLEIFDAYTHALDERFDGFSSLGLDWSSWDSLKNSYRSQVDSTTSRGRFCAIMNYFTTELRDMHTIAFDSAMIDINAINPDTPVLIADAFMDVNHFGAVTTALPDCTCLVLRVVENHPLDLQPGDILLGYEGTSYPIILKELLDAQIPVIIRNAGAKSAEVDIYYKLAGMNWHLFETIDILKYSTGDTVHFSLEPMISLDVPPMKNNEQMEMPGIPFADYYNNQVVSYGILNNTNIGYIYLLAESWRESPTADEQFYEAVNALKNTEGLIIDLRWNIGGLSFFDDACKILFNNSPYTLNGAFRCDPSSFDLCPNDQTIPHQIKGDPQSMYDHPIALLLGSSCHSYGDRTAHRFSYHAMLKSFGKPPAASFGTSNFVETYPDWLLRYSKEDMYHVSQPGVYLNHSEFPIDFPVWFDPDDVAKGEDTIVKKALDWMQNLAYAHDVTVNKTFVIPETEEVAIRAIVENPIQDQLSITAELNSINDVLIDSLILYNDGEHADGEANDSLWGNTYMPRQEQTYKVSVTTDNMNEESSLTLPNVAWFTTIGPLVLTGDLTFHPWYDSTFHSGNQVKFKMHLRNESSTSTATDIQVKLTSPTPLITLADSTFGFPDIAPGTSTESFGYYDVSISGDIYPDTIIYLPIMIYSYNYPLWSDSIQLDVISAIEDNRYSKIPTVFALQQNYPNPFNPITMINYQLPIISDVELSIYDLLGQKVARLINKRQKPGYYQVKWDASAFSSGIYFYRIEAGEFQAVKRMILIR
jgi:hypothetical protein